MGNGHPGPGAMALGESGQGRAGRRPGWVPSWLAGALAWVEPFAALPPWLRRRGAVALGLGVAALALLAGLLAGGDALVPGAAHAVLAATLLLAAASLALLVTALLRQQHLYRELAGRLREAGGMDLLTGVAGRSRFAEAVEREYGRFRRYEQPVAAICLQVDFFNRLADAYGEDMADRLLVRLAALVRQELRDSDLVGRLGECEFAALLPGVDSDGASTPATRICEGAARLCLPSDLGDLRFTVSVGVTHFQHRDRDGQALLRRAKVALVAAVFAGRNRVALSDGVLLFPQREKTRQD